ncbi:type I DNA topoisomerase [Candidatus Thiodictyon syntrophicum]|jgi:DNA topoisomerase-1|uniref:DNA topoisomerase 1 n=1 Tax=Candidatus Thiodictyon syntrophicum TaxID=1166950 RepID=A0A2K8UBW7_9GAMM|nr:type I DNA topoisomerase [Candidatus Thiodictyon syntrophicum]AUB83078.1 DNA topoisomerase I [Candidatus Thiodictyon syntrophicum]
MNLVVVESPAKAKTIKKYLGPDFEVVASYGHVRDLIPKEGAVDPEHGFEMKYQIIERNEKHVQAIAKLLKDADALYLATDPDREGEAISWHLYELLKARRQLGKRPVYRVVFNEITKRAVQEAVANPRELAYDLVNAQQARRALDYLVGFNLSPLLWKKIRRGLSAGRVQSPALRLICERETEIEAFLSQEYWSIEADCQGETRPFAARLVEFGGEKVEQFTITDAARAAEVQAALEQAADGKLRVEQVERKQRKRFPAPPFITSTLQQEAARKLGFTALRTMRVAQQLYEGVDVGGGAVGLISYMRTDSVNLAQEAIAEIRAYVTERYGEGYLPEQPRLYKTKAKNAQEAHEAIRPTSVLREPGAVKAFLSVEQFKLYELVWKRSVACQMAHALINQVSVSLSAGPGNGFRATGSTVAEAGFMRVYLEGRDDATAADDDEDSNLPPMQEGDLIVLKAIRAEQHFTEPPPRFSEATLVKALEEFGIGRPSTYASIITTLQEREYVVLDKKRFLPTDVGRVVNKFLTEYFATYVDYDFTARLEDDLDAVSRGEAEWVPLLERFWRPFKERIDHTQETVKRSDVTQEPIAEICPKCGGPLSIRLGRNGRFIGCTNYPECDYTRDLNADKAAAEPKEVIEGRVCPDCGSPLEVKNGRYGKFIGCSGYPKCKHIEPLERPEDTGVTCPKCTKGTLQKKKSRRGKVFFSCSTYPKCDYAVWNDPIAEPCPRCGWPVLTIKTTKRNGTEKVCPQKDCTFSEPYEGVGTPEEVEG